MHNDERLDIVPAKAGEPFFPFVTRSAPGGKSYLSVWCEEHKRAEWVYSASYRKDIGDWYHLGIHPRFSPLKALYGAGQRADEIARIVGAGHDERADAARGVFLKALSASRTAEELLENLNPILFTDLRTGDRNSRVTNAFKKRFDAKAFTVDEFLAEENQELRRLILRSGISIKDVLARMKLIAKDEEGELYEMVRPGVVRPVMPFNLPVDPMRYLHVTCPSTGAEYLLEVPISIWNGKETVQLDSPRIARRWTFDLPPDAEFAKEA